MNVLLIIIMKMCFVHSPKIIIFSTKLSNNSNPTQTQNFRAILLVGVVDSNMAMADEEEENGYVTIGSAFKQLETDDDVQREKNRKDKDQYVLDKQGRRRFHGAFTGGFSAGYYNTVGSKEGQWSYCSNVNECYT